jgi:HlyD family secretion protein
MFQRGRLRQLQASRIESTFVSKSVALNATALPMGAVRKAASVASNTAAWNATDHWITIGNRTVYWLLGGLIVFTSLVSINGAVVASGTVTVESNYKSVQHLDGGIVSKILVRNGDRVAQGDVLVRLDDTAARTNLAVVKGRVNDQLVQQARLEAEQGRKPAMTLPPEVMAAAADPALAKIIATQRNLFDARRAAHSGELQVLRERIAQLTADRAGTEFQLEARTREYDITAQELANVRPLFEKGFANQQRYGGLQRDAARLEGELGRLKSDLLRSKGALAEAELRLLQSDKEYTQAVVDELKKVQAALAEQEETRTQLTDKLDRTEIRSPKAGRVHALAVHTEGGVIQPANTILTIIPEGEKLIVEAQVQPQDIDKVRKGMAASLRFTAFNAKSTPKLDGTLSNISAAQITDNQNKSFFTAQIEVSAEELKKLGPEHQLKPGMPAEVYIETSSRSILSYFLKPLGDIMSRAFRET